MYASVSKGQRCSRLNLTVSQSFLNSECRLYSRQNLKALLATSLYRTSKVLLLRTRSRMLRKASQRKRNHGVSTTLSVRDCVSSPLTVLRRRLHVRKGSGRGATIKCGKTPTTPPRVFSQKTPIKGFETPHVSAAPCTLHQWYVHEFGILGW